MSSLTNILKVAKETFGDTPPDITPATRLDDLMKRDSLSFVEFIFTLDELDEIEFREEDVQPENGLDSQGDNSCLSMGKVDNWTLQQLADYIDASRK